MCVQTQETTLAVKLEEAEAAHQALLAERDSAHVKLQQQVRLVQITDLEQKQRAVGTHHSRFRKHTYLK